MFCSHSPGGVKVDVPRDLIFIPRPTKGGGLWRRLVSKAVHPARCQSFRISYPEHISEIGGMMSLIFHTYIPAYCIVNISVLRIQLSSLPDGAPVWHFVSRRGAGCCLKTPEIQTKWPFFILFIPARFEFLIVYIFLTRP